MRNHLWLIEQTIQSFYFDNVTKFEQQKFRTFRPQSVFTSFIEKNEPEKRLIIIDHSIFWLFFLTLIKPKRSVSQTYDYVEDTKHTKVLGFYTGFRSKRKFGDIEINRNIWIRYVKILYYLSISSKFIKKVFVRLRKRRKKGRPIYSIDFPIVPCIDPQRINKLQIKYIDTISSVRGTLSCSFFQFWTLKDQKILLKFIRNTIYTYYRRRKLRATQKKIIIKKKRKTS